MRETAHGFVLVTVLILGIITAGCTTDDTPLQAPPPANAPEKGVLIQAIGNVTGQGVILQGVPRGTVDTITFSIGLAPGVKTLDITNTTIVYSDAVRSESLQPVDGYWGEPPPGFWGIVDTINEPGNRNLRLEFEKQFVIRVNPKAPVVPNQVITLSVKPVTGRPLIIRRVTPSVISEDDNLLPGI